PPARSGGCRFRNSELDGNSPGRSGCDIRAPEPIFLAMNPLPTIIGLTRDELAAALAVVGVPENERRMRMRQIWGWVHQRGATSFLAMTSIAKELRHRLEAAFSIERPEIVTEQISSDGTRKWLLRLAPDERGQRHEIETVYIPEEDR